MSTQQLNKYICTFPQLFTQTLKINQFECKKYLLFTKETLSQCYSQSTFSRQEKVLNAQLGETYLLQQLIFEINKKKCQLVPVPKIKFLGLVVNSVSMASPLRENKEDDVQTYSNKLTEIPQTMVMRLTQLLETCSF